jgi:hypothetical protein
MVKITSEMGEIEKPQLFIKGNKRRKDYCLFFTKSSQRSLSASHCNTTAELLCLSESLG